MPEPTPTPIPGSLQEWNALHPEAAAMLAQAAFFEQRAAHERFPHGLPAELKGFLAVKPSGMSIKDWQKVRQMVLSNAALRQATSQAVQPFSEPTPIPQPSSEPTGTPAPIGVGFDLVPPPGSVGSTTDTSQGPVVKRAKPAGNIGSRTARTISKFGPGFLPAAGTLLLPGVGTIAGHAANIGIKAVHRGAQARRAARAAAHAAAVAAGTPSPAPSSMPISEPTPSPIDVPTPAPTPPSVMPGGFFGPPGPGPIPSQSPVPIPAGFGNLVQPQPIPDVPAAPAGFGDLVQPSPIPDVAAQPQPTPDFVGTFSVPPTGDVTGLFGAPSFGLDSLAGSSAVPAGSGGVSGFGVPFDPTGIAGFGGSMSLSGPLSSSDFASLGAAGDFSQPTADATFFAPPGLQFGGGVQTGDSTALFGDPQATFSDLQVGSTTTPPAIAGFDTSIPFDQPNPNIGIDAVSPTLFGGSTAQPSGFTEPSPVQGPPPYNPLVQGSIGQPGGVQTIQANQVGPNGNIFRFDPTTGTYTDTGVPASGGGGGGSSHGVGPGGPGLNFTGLSPSNVAQGGFGSMGDLVGSSLGAQTGGFLPVGGGGSLNSYLMAHVLR